MNSDIHINYLDSLYLSIVIENIVSTVNLFSIVLIHILLILYQFILESFFHFDQSHQLLMFFFNALYKFPKINDTIIIHNSIIDISRLSLQIVLQLHNSQIDTLKIRFIEDMNRL